MRRWQIIGGLLVSLVAIGSIACNQLTDDNQKPGQQLVQVVRGDLTVTISGSGKIKAAHEAKLTFGTGGKIDKIYVKKGDRVSENDILARLDTTPLERTLKTAELTVSTAKLAVTTAELALTTAEIDVKTAEDAIKVAEIDLEQANNSFRQMTYPYTYSTFVFDIPQAVANINDASRHMTEIDKALEIGLTPNQYQELLRHLKEVQENLTDARQQLSRGEGEDVFEAGIVPFKDIWLLRAAQLTIEKAESALTTAKNNRDKANLALEKAKNDLNQAKNAVIKAINEQDRVKDELEKSVIRASFDGVVANVYPDDGYPEEGHTVSALTPVIRLLDLTTMKLTANIDEMDIPGVKSGQRAIISVDALPDAQIEGKVISISPSANERAGVVTYEVTVGFDVSEGVGLKPAMNATANIIINERSNVLLVPKRAIKYDSQGNHIVSIMVKGETEVRPVVIGLSDGIQTEIVTGLNEGEVIQN